MIGIIVCCHGEMAAGMLSAAQLIVGPQDNAIALGLMPGQGQDELRKELKRAIRKNGKDGAVILTDLPGGTPCNVAAMMLDDNTQMITGFNLPLLISLLMKRTMVGNVDELVAGAADHGKESMMDSKTLLGGNTR